MRYFTIILFVALIAGIGALHDLSAQAVIPVAPVVSPTYIAIPPVQQEVITEAPAAGYVWVNGHWNRTADDWNWTPGTWVQPPFSNAYWVPGYWQHHEGQYTWETAHWAAAEQGVIVQKPVTVPAVYEEVQPAAPTVNTNVVWQPGHWEWRGTWVWIQGAYVQSVQPAAVWVPGQWVAGAGGLWNWSPGHWALA